MIDASAFLNRITSSSANFFVPQASILCDIMSNVPPKVEEWNAMNFFVLVTQIQKVVYLGM
jgi:hypothetical protein